MSSLLRMGPCCSIANSAASVVRIHQQRESTGGENLRSYDAMSDEPDIANPKGCHPISRD